MRIALVVTGGLHPSGRQEVMPAWLWLIERLALVHEVHAFVLRHLPQATTYPLVGATVHDLGRPSGRWSQWQALRSALRATGSFDVIHGFWVDPNGLVAAIAGRRLSIPSVVTCDSGEFTALPGIAYGLQRTSRGRVAVALACRLATRVHVTTAFMESLARAHGYDVVRIPIGVDLSRVAAPGARPEGPPWRLLQVASLNPVKDQTTLLQAVAIARRSMDVRLDLVGEDTLDGHLQRAAAQLGIAGAISFHGFVPHDALAPFHRAAHLYVQSSLHEAAGAAVLEAAAAGVPVVGTRVGYVSDWDGRAAVAVSPGDPEALAKAILRSLANPAERTALADAARQFAVAHDVGWTANALSALYQSLR
jgi:glycosyltransferase involved in cell wall biosynthesis